MVACTICARKDRRAIEEALLELSVRDAARQFGVTQAALKPHLGGHLPPDLEPAPWLFRSRHNSPHHLVAGKAEPELTIEITSRRDSRSVLVTFPVITGQGGSRRGA
jgi:hypothetical protein